MLYIRRYNSGVSTIIKKNIFIFYSYNIFLNHKEIELWSTNPKYIYNKFISEDYNFRFKFLRVVRDFFSNDYEDMTISNFKRRYGAELI